MCSLYVSMSSSNITITVDKELKKRMGELKQVNWSKVARAAFEEEIRKEKRRLVTKQIKTIREKDQSNWSGSEEVRKWRDARR
jgi:post-segregation antitoxin (ccd killing protein)